MATEKQTLIIPNEKDFKPQPIPFGVVTGEGVDNFDGDDKEYSVSILLDKKMKKDILNSVQAYWDEHKPSGAGDKPDNFKNIVRDTEDGGHILYSKTKTHFGDKQNIITIVNHEGVKLDPQEFGMIGEGSLGRLAVKMGIYTQGKRSAGVSLYLSAVKLTKFVAYSGGDASSAFGQEDGEVSGAGEFKAEKKEKKAKKKKKNK